VRKDLAEARDLGVRHSRQVTDLPEARAETIQYDRHEAQCACGRIHVADAPPQAAGAPGTVTYASPKQTHLGRPRTHHCIMMK
jgi:hypothetical protein